MEELILKHVMHPLTLWKITEINPMRMTAEVSTLRYAVRVRVRVRVWVRVVRARVVTPVSM